MSIDERPGDALAEANGHEESAFETADAPAQLAEPLATNLPAPRAPKVRAKPVEAAERVAAVDVIRGVALLGILAMNIASFAWPGAVYAIPIMAEGYGPLDTPLWAFNHVVFETKMMSLFSMLFGAGLVLMSDRADSRGAKLRGVYYRRVFWLLLIGIAHAALVWEGDVLVLYALCGFLLYPFRKLKPRTLIITGVVFNLLLAPVLFGFRLFGIPYMERTAQRVDAQVKVEEKPGWWDQSVHDAWKEMSKEEMPKREKTLEQIAKYRGPYGELVKERAISVLWEPLMFLFAGWWMAGGRMLIGMGFMKLGVFAAKLQPSTYKKMMIWGYGIGLPYMLFDAWHQSSHGFFLGHRLWYTLDGWPLITLLGSIPVVIGHIGLVMLVYQAGAVPWLTRRLAAVGRMALTNYLMTSIVCTTIFYGYGFDLFATLHRPMLYLVVLAIWTVQLLISPIWLRIFRYGPFEWLWRSLTYWKLQPILARPSSPELAALPG
jgi:uncharacterized protein